MEARDFVNDLQSWGLTQEQIAARSGVPQPTVSKIARGQVKDVFSRTYRSLESIHREESAKRANDSEKARM
jgi:transcriptional regulator with XRE-family HTH domain